MREFKNYMFFANLKQISRDIERLMSLDKQKIDDMISNGHDWAGEHVTTAKDDIEEVTNFLLGNIEGDDRPYSEEIAENGIITRTFTESVNPNELEWHRDKKDRIVKAINENDWMIQFDNELPKKININEEIRIPKETFHRVIKGTTDLVVEINESDLEDSEKSSTFVKNDVMKESIAPAPVKPEVAPEVKPKSPRRKRIWETKPVVKPKPKMDSVNEDEFDQIDSQGSDDEITYYCNIYDMYSTISDSTPYGTCMCS